MKETVFLFCNYWVLCIYVLFYMTSVKGEILYNLSFMHISKCDNNIFLYFKTKFHDVYSKYLNFMILYIRQSTKIFWTDYGKKKKWQNGMLVSFSWLTSFIRAFTKFRCWGFIKRGEKNNDPRISVPSTVDLKRYFSIKGNINV